MKKILLFLFAIILTTIKIDASVPYQYKIHFKQQTLGYDKVNVGGAKITSAVYEIYEVTSNGEYRRGKVSSSTNVGFSERTPVTYHIIETSYSNGYYENELFDYTFTLNPKCPNIDILIEKKVKEYELKFINKTSNKLYYYLFDYKGNVFQNKTEFEHEDSLTVPYDTYLVRTAFGEFVADLINLDQYENGILFENDSLVVIGSEVLIDTPYKPVITINKSCIEEITKEIEEPINDTVKEDHDEIINQISSEISLPNVPLEDTNEVMEIAIPKVVIEPIESEEPIPIKSELPIAESNEILMTNDTVKPKPISKQKVKVKEDSVIKLIEEEPESNLIIEYVSDEVTNEKISYHKSSNLPLIIIILLSIFSVLIVKIIKKVQKN